jgi:hypothetical protein
MPNNRINADWQSYVATHQGLCQPVMRDVRQRKEDELCQLVVIARVRELSS